MLNAYWEALDFELSPCRPAAGAWRRIVDTSLAAPDDIAELRSAPEIAGSVYRTGPRSTVVLASRVGDEPNARKRR